jgi:hypothetical protein
LTKIFLIISITTLICFSNADNNNASELNIRLSNISQFDFENVIVDSRTGNTDFKNISSQQMANNKTVQIAYRYALVGNKLLKKLSLFHP